MDLESIFRVHQQEIYVYFYRTIGDVSRAEDLAQETFVRAFEGLVRFRGDASFRTWLFGIARNVLAESRRTRRGAALDPMHEEQWDPDPGQKVIVEEALASLPLASREAIVLCDVLGFEPSEAAAIAGTTANAFRVRLHRARARFKEVYADDRV